MDLMRHIENKPMVSFDAAFNIITYATILQYGVPYPESLTAAIKRIKSNIAMLMNSDSSITRQCKGDSCPDDYSVAEGFNFEEYFGYGFSQYESTIVFKELLSSYNLALESNGLNQTLITNSANFASTSLTVNAPSEAILELVKLIANSVRNIYDRQEKITNNLVDSILDEQLKQITDSTIYKLLPEIKSSLKKIAKDKITPGRPRTVDTKKMQAAIDLAEHFKDKLYKEILRKDIDVHLKKHHSDLSKSDREDVVNVYLQSKEE